jgi:hypothetical protein
VMSSPEGMSGGARPASPGQGGSHRNFHPLRRDGSREGADAKSPEL